MRTSRLERLVDRLAGPGDAGELAQRGPRPRSSQVVGQVDDRALGEAAGGTGVQGGRSGCHPLVAFLDNTGEFLAGVLGGGNAVANTAADHIAVPPR